RDVEYVLLEHPADVALDIIAKPRVDLVQYVAAVLERPHLADRLVADAGQDSADVIEISIDSAPFFVPMRLFGRRPQQDREAFAALGVAHGAGPSRLVGHVIHAGLMVNDRPEDGVDRDVLHALAVDPDFAAVAQRGAILVSGSDHAYL